MSAEIQQISTIASLLDLKTAAKSMKKPLILKFTAPFCNPCKIMAEELKKYKGRDIALVNIDVRENVELMKHFGVRAVPYCCVLDEECAVVRDRSGLMYVDEFERLLAAFLQMRHYGRTTLVMMNNTWCVKRSITVFNANTVMCSYVVGQDTKPLIIKKHVKKSVKQEDEQPKLIKLDARSAKIVVHARENMKMTQKDLAGKINKPVGVVRDAEKGVEVERSVVEMIEGVLGVKVQGGTNCDDNVADEIRYDNGLVHGNETTDNMNSDEEIDVGDQYSDVFYGAGEEIRAVDYSCNGMPGTDHKSELELNEPKSSGDTQTKKRRVHTPLFIQHGRFYDSTQNKEMESHSSGLVRDVAPCNLEPTNSSSGDAVPSRVSVIVELSAHNPPTLPVHGDDTSIVSRNVPERDFNHKRSTLESSPINTKQMKYGAQNCLDSRALTHFWPEQSAICAKDAENCTTRSKEQIANNDAYHVADDNVRQDTPCAEPFDIYYRKKRLFMAGNEYFGCSGRNAISYGAILRNRRIFIMNCVRFVQHCKNYIHELPYKLHTIRYVCIGMKYVLLDRNFIELYVNCKVIAQQIECVFSELNLATQLMNQVIGKLYVRCPQDMKQAAENISSNFSEVMAVQRQVLKALADSMSEVGRLVLMMDLSKNVRYGENNMMAGGSESCNANVGEEQEVVGGSYDPVKADARQNVSHTERYSKMKRFESTIKSNTHHSAKHGASVDEKASTSAENLGWTEQPQSLRREYGDNYHLMVPPYQNKNENDIVYKTDALQKLLQKLLNECMGVADGLKNSSLFFQNILWIIQVSGNDDKGSKKRRC